jgi:hypothetical protein
MKINSINIILTLLIGIILASCDSMYDVHEQYIQEGGIIYAARPYETKVKAGDNRVVVKMLFVSGANLRKNVILWNDGADSIITDLTLNPAKDSMEIEVKGIPEGSYIFYAYNLDKENNRSIKVQAIGNVFGEKYKATLLNRAVNSITKNDTAMVINWAQPKVGDNGVELIFNDKNGNELLYRVKADELTTYIVNWQLGGTMKYTTLYMPEEDAVDEFPSKTETLSMIK